MGESRHNCESIGAAVVVVLLAADDDVVRAHLRACLEVHGYSVQEACHGQEALGADCGTNVRLLLTDVVLPDMSGRELAASLRATRPDLKVIFVSAYAGSEFSENDLLPEDGALLRKPFTVEALLCEVRRALGR